MKKSQIFTLLLLVVIIVIAIYAQTNSEAIPFLSPSAEKNIGNSIATGALAFVMGISIVGATLVSILIINNKKEKLPS